MRLMNSSMSKKRELLVKQWKRSTILSVGKGVIAGASVSRAVIFVENSTFTQLVIRTAKLILQKMIMPCARQKQVCFFTCV